MDSTFWNWICISGYVWRLLVFEVDVHKVLFVFKTIFGNYRRKMNLWFWQSNSISNQYFVFQDSIIHSICSTSDIDFFCHMNNGKYFRELDFGRYVTFYTRWACSIATVWKLWNFASFLLLFCTKLKVHMLIFYRFDFYFRCGLSEYLATRKHMYVVQHEAMIRWALALFFLWIKLQNYLAWLSLDFKSLKFISNEIHFFVQLWTNSKWKELIRTRRLNEFISQF